MTKSMKGCIAFGLIFCVAAITFALLYHFKIIDHMTLTLTAVYVCYCVGVAMIYNAIYSKNQLKIITSRISGVIAAIFILGSTALLIYGLINGQIMF